jgi:polyferredoxin
MFIQELKQVEIKNPDTKKPEVEQMGRRTDLFKKIPLLKRFVKTRAFQFLLILPNLFVFYVIIIAGFIGTPVGNKNLAIVLIWILWWFLLIAIMVPFASRVWCTVCPLPFFGDLFQRMSFIKVRAGKTAFLRNKLYGLNKKWPKALTNIWIQNIGFLTLCTFSAVLVTRPFVTAMVLGLLLLMGTVFAMIWRLRAFCSYICPVSGFLSLYSMTSTLELRSVDKDVCRDCKDKGCYKGNENGWGCPWFVYMGTTERNNYCGLCMECVKSCPNDNIALNTRPFATETKIKGFDESWKGFIMLALAMAYSVILLGTNGTVKNWANAPETGNWGGFLMYAGILWSSALAIVPGVFYGFSYLSRRLSKVKTIAVKEVFKAYSYILVPLGLLAWIAFSFPLIFVNGSYIISVISDPLGWGWNLFGTAGFRWQPLLPEYLIYVQLILLLTGLGFAIDRGYTVGLRLFKSQKAAIGGLIPMACFATLVTLAFIVFFIG